MSVHVFFLIRENLRGKYPIILRMREQSVAGLLSPKKRPVKEATCMHAILNSRFTVRGSCLIRENHEHLYPRNIPAIRYIAGDINLEGLFGHAVTLSDNAEYLVT